jgi:hypothetical protein
MPNVTGSASLKMGCKIRKFLATKKELKISLGGQIDPRLMTATELSQK